ncbi:hypothetical protein CEE37_06920 [candidate division LCP-89 bacterium B3_LCP]|uniref:Outer membrane lipoprotein BamD-like domain-containing protein n=1 Tax=candidate division LCP-89 bacterium B3_LCP TaxID=2012998 RepID=A0A532V0M0_UNCL8|nr:MAG: hypothetical protein CEE37_06920 [candidate division LCP-89 bacterium B3_LCP]
MNTMNLKNLIYYIGIAAIVLVLFSGCGRVVLEEESTAIEQWEVAKNYFEREKFLDAIEILTLFTLNYSGSTLIDSAQYLLGESHFVLKEYILAESEYQRLVQNFPESPLVDDAILKIILCNFYISPRFELDQEYTEKTVNVIADFTDMYSGTDLTVLLSATPTTGQVIRSILTLGIWGYKKPAIADVPLEHTKVVYPRRRLGLGKWLLRVFTFGIYSPELPELKTPPSAQVDGDWLVRRAYDESLSRLAKKDYKSGELYFRMKKYPSAIIYFDSVIERFDSTPWAELALKLKGDSYLAMKDYQEAAQNYQRYLKKYPDGNRNTVESRLKECQKHIGNSISSAESPIP